MVDIGGIGKKFKTLLSSAGGLIFMLFLFGGGDIITDMIGLSVGGDNRDQEAIEPVKDDVLVDGNTDTVGQTVENISKVPPSSHAPLVVALPFFIMAGVLAVWFLRRKRG